MRSRTLGLLEDIRASIGYFVEDTADMTCDEFVRERLVRQAVERSFEIIGEAMNRLRPADPVLVEQISADGPIIGLRNVLMHGDDVINYSMVWHAVTVSLPVLAKEVYGLLQVSS